MFLMVLGHNPPRHFTPPVPYPLDTYPPLPRTPTYPTPPPPPDTYPLDKYPLTKANKIFKTERMLSTLW